MISVKLSYIAKTLGWHLVGDDITISSVSTDSRTAKKGDCFIALYGDNFDAHDFIEQVIERGVNALIVSCKQPQTNVSQLIVDDTRLALAQLAGLVKSLANVKTIAITGSCGKTTVKEMITAILSLRGNVLSTIGNFNNDIGVPLTLLRLNEAHQYAVIELGANHVGEIDFTSKITQPDVALITNIGAAHLEGFGSIEGVVTAKSEIFNHLTANGVAIFDSESDYAQQWNLQNSQQHIAQFSDNSEPQGALDVWASDVTIDSLGHASFILNMQQQQRRLRLALPGLHNVKNALASAAATLAIGASLDDVVQGLQSMSSVKGRLNVTRITQALTVIDDTYNANASSIKAAIDVLANTQGYKVLVLGDMAELGKYAVDCHQSLGIEIENNHIDLLLTYGELSIHYAHQYRGMHQHFDNKEALNQYIEQHIMNFETTQNMTVLVKGSRSATMESVVEFIKNNKKIGAPSQC